MKILLPCFCAFLLGATATRADVTTPTSSAYDSANNANAVDRNANGNALSATGMLDVVGFTSNVATAYTNNTGGVIDFDSPNGGATMVSTQTGSIVATFGSGANKTLSLAVSTTNATPSIANRFDLRSSSAGITTISGAFFLIPNNAADTSIRLTLSGITGAGASPNERVTQVGFTLLDRSTITGTPTVSASYSDGTTGTLNGAAFTAATANEDTFYAFAAPTGAYISSVTVTYAASVADARLTIDDFGFITAVPEPSTLASCVLALGLLGGWWVRRARGVSERA